MSKAAFICQGLECSYYSRKLICSYFDNQDFSKNAKHSQVPAFQIWRFSKLNIFWIFDCSLPNIRFPTKWPHRFRNALRLTCVFVLFLPSVYCRVWPALGAVWGQIPSLPWDVSCCSAPRLHPLQLPLRPWSWGVGYSGDVITTRGT